MGLMESDPGFPGAVALGPTTNNLPYHDVFRPALSLSFAKPRPSMQPPHKCLDQTLRQQTMHACNRQLKQQITTYIETKTHKKENTHRAQEPEVLSCLVLFL